MGLKSIILDDEPLAIELLEDYACNMEQLDIVRTFTSALTANRYIRENPIDLIFLDIEMPHIKGTDFLASITDPPLVIFTTAHRQYALEGYDYNIVDFLLKPITFTRFCKAIDKAALLSDIHQLNHKKETRKQLFVRSGTKMVKLYIEEILFIEGMRDYLKIHTIDDRLIVVKKTLKSMSELLEKHHFIRVHKSFIVAHKYIEKMSRQRLEVKNKSIPIGRNYLQLVRSLIKTYDLESLQQ
ncbi:MAG: response regulator transcription factor [Bacteroidia bacterium]|nr:response regulator transcription factor [Bacteroidia bacterium]